MKKLTAFCCILAVAAGLPLASAQSNRGLVATVDVSVVDVVVIVRDSDGNPVTGLARENFQIWADGVLQEVTNFSERQPVAVNPPASAATVPEAAPETAPTPAPTRTPEPAATEDNLNRVVFFFDNLHLHPLQRNWITKEITPFVEDLTEGGGQGMVIAFDRRLETLQRFTNDQRHLTRAIEKAKKRSGGGIQRRRDRAQLQEELNEMFSRNSTNQITAGGDEIQQAQQLMQPVRSYVSSIEDDLKRSLNALMSVADMLSGIEGRKAILYISDGIEVMPGEEIFAFVEQAFPRSNIRLEAMNYDHTDTFKDLTARCNAFGVTLYPVTASGLSVSGNATADTNRPWDPRYRGAGMDGLKDIGVRAAATLMADDTGGIAFVGTNKIKEAMKRVDDDLSYYYSLGISAPASYDKNYDLKVALSGVDGDPDVRIRRGFSSFSGETKVSHAVISNLLLPRGENPLDIRMDFEPVTQMNRKKATLPMRIWIPWKSLLMLPDGDMHRGEIEAKFAFMDKDGKVSSVRELRQPIELPSQYVEAAQNERYVYSVDMDLEPGPWTISVAVRDTTSDETSYLRVNKLVSRFKQ